MDLWPFFFLAMGFLVGVVVRTGWLVSMLFAKSIRDHKISYRQGFRDCATQALQFMAAHGPRSIATYLKTVEEHEWTD